jgi:eukaryotic-like serine/threonine-protein kinase
VASDPANLKGELLGGKYRLGDVIGAGGMGVVYEATHTELRTPCAVKVVDPARGDPLQFRRLVREARVLALLSGPHAVRVLDAGRLPGGSPYLVMERLAGEPLSELLKRTGRLPCRQAIDFACQICAAVGEAHAAGIIHRDIKPSNVFVVAKDRIKVLDFGLATRFGPASEDSTATASEFAGSPRYMSPEQIRSSAEVTPSSDLWSIAVLMFEMLTGRLPFDGPSTGALLAAIVADPAMRLKSVLPDAPLELDRLIADCLEKNPDDRPRDAAEVRARLEALPEIAIGSPFSVAISAAAAIGPDSGGSTVSDEAPVARATVQRASARALVLLATLATVAMLIAALQRSASNAAPQRASAPVTKRALGNAIEAGPRHAAPTPFVGRAPAPALDPMPDHQETAARTSPVSQPVVRQRPSHAASRAESTSVLDAISTRH